MTISQFLDDDNDDDNNNNNNKTTIFIVQSSTAKPYVGLHLGHLYNCQ